MIESDRFEKEQSWIEMDTERMKKIKSTVKEFFLHLFFKIFLQKKLLWF